MLVYLRLLKESFGFAMNALTNNKLSCSQEVTIDFFN
jgi:hypothetical protein